MGDQNQNRNYNLIDFSDEEINEQEVENNNFAYYCEICNRGFNDNRGYTSHKRSAKHRGKELNNTEERKIQNYREYLHNNTFLIHYKNFNDFVYSEYTLIENDIDYGFTVFKDLLSNFLNIFKKSFKFYISCNAKYYKYTMFDELDPYKYTDMFHSTHAYIIDKSIYVNKELNTALSFLREKVRESELRESGWNFISFNNLKLHITRYNNNSAGSYCKLPFKSNYIINIKNDNDEFCFLWSIIAHLHPAKSHVDRLNNYNKQEYKNEFDLSNGLDQFPYTYDTIKKFCEKNKELIEVNVFEINDQKQLTPIIINHDYYINQGKYCNLLYYNGHYVLCKNVSLFIANEQTHIHFPCLRCMTSYRKKEELVNHKKFCENNEVGGNTFPKNDYLTYNKFYYKNKVPFTIYCDLEAWNRPINNDNENEEKTTKIFEQKPMCYGMYINSNYPEIFQSEYIEYFGEDCAEKLVRKIEELQETFYRLLQTNIPLTMTKNDWDNYNDSSKCYYCKKDLLYYVKEFENDEYVLKNDKVRDHDHLNGKYRGAAHNSCNLNANKYKYNFVPLYFYNGSHYDVHLIFKELFKSEKLKNLKKTNVLCKTDEEYFSLQFGCIRILDAMRFFTPYSLEFMGATLKPNKCKILNKYNLKNIKGIYPYEYIKGESFQDIINIMNETKLPSHNDFYSTLKQSNITYSEYGEAKNNWEELRCNSIYDYTMKYLKIDVLILADLFENFREMCLSYYEIDPCYCYSTPGLTWLAGLKYTGVSLKHYKENTLNKSEFFETGIRGGVSSVLGNRYVNCYNKKVSPEYGDFKQINKDEAEKILKSFDNIKDGDSSNQVVEDVLKENYLLYYDYNSLYASCMVQELPTGEMEWSDNLEYSKTLNGIKNPGYVYEVDLEYCKELKDKTKYFPFCPEKIKPYINEFTEYQNSTIPEHYKPTKKLILTQHNKTNYIVEGRMLDWYLNHGMKLIKIHKKLEYKKSSWLKSYIEFNVEKRNEAKDNKDIFGKTFFKLMNNAFYGKTLENVRNRQNIEIVSDRNKYLQVARRPSYKRTTMFSEDVVAVHLKRCNVYHDKFNFIGFTILELAKLFMYQLIYDYIEPSYGSNYKIHFSDTDSIFLELLIPLNSSLEQEIDKIKDIIHPSDLCKVKDELEGDHIKKAIFLLSKCYAFETLQMIERKLKGISKATLKEHISIEDYENTLFNNVEKCVDNYRLTSNKHTEYLIKQNKIALRPFDDKRIILNDGITTLPYGYFSSP